MAATGFTPIQLYYSTTASAAPSSGNLANGELALNITDGRLFYKDNGGVVQVLATKGAGTIGGSNTQVQYNSSGALAGSANLTFDGTTMTANALTVSNAVTLSAGTANGVPYLNASKVLTTGTALTFDGTNFAVAGGGVWSTDSAGNARSKFEVFTNGQTTNQITLGQGFAGPTDNVGYLFNRANAAFVFGVNNAEQMRLTSTGLGIGTSSPLGTLDVVSPSSSLGMNLRGRSSDDIGTLSFYTNNGVTSLAQVQMRPSDNEFRFLVSGARSLTFYTNGSERMRLDASGNLGLGVTPSAWGSSNRALQVATTGAIWSPGGADTRLSNNQYRNSASSRVYIANGPAQEYAQDSSGNHVWLTAPSGTAGTAISFTQAMTLSQSSGSTTLEVTANNAINNLSTLRLSSPYYNYWDLINDSNLRFVRGTSEWMRIDSSGNLLVGTTSSSGARMDLVAGATQNALNIRLPTVDYFGMTVHNQATSGSNCFIAFGTEASYTNRGSIIYNRGSGVTAYQTTSDYRAKDINGPVLNALATVAQLKPYMGTMKGATVERPMFVAHETQAVAPYAVTGEKDAVDKDGNPVFQQMDHSTLVPLLTAAIQEQQAIINQLKADVAALKGA